MKNWIGDEGGAWWDKEMPSLGSLHLMSGFRTAKKQNPIGFVHFNTKEDRGRKVRRRRPRRSATKNKSARKRKRASR